MDLYVIVFLIVEVENESTKDNNVVIDSSPIEWTSLLRFIQALEFEHSNTKVEPEHNSQHVNDELLRNNIPEGLDIITVARDNKVSPEDCKDQKSDESNKVAEDEENRFVGFCKVDLVNTSLGSWRDESEIFFFVLLKVDGAILVITSLSILRLVCVIFVVRAPHFVVLLSCRNSGLQHSVGNSPSLFETESNREKQ